MLSRLLAGNLLLMSSSDTVRTLSRHFVITDAVVFCQVWQLLPDRFASAHRMIYPVESIAWLHPL